MELSLQRCYKRFSEYGSALALEEVPVFSVLTSVNVALTNVFMRLIVCALSAKKCWRFMAPAPQTFSITKVLNRKAI
jgi:hypothetical protein